MLRRGRTRTEEGFSLVELLVSIVILGVITFPLGNAVIGALKGTTTSGGRLNESHDAQISASYWGSDIANVGTRNSLDPLDPQLRQSVETGVAYNDGLYSCGSAGTPSAVVRLASDDVVASPGRGATTTLVVTSYVVVTTSSGKELHRLRCAGSTTPGSDLTVVHNLLTTPTVLCDGTSDCDGTGTAVPRTITLTMQVQDSHTDDASFELTLNGQRRQE